MKHDCEKKEFSFFIKKTQVECFGSFGNSKPLKKLPLSQVGKRQTVKSGNGRPRRESGVSMGGPNIWKNPALDWFFFFKMWTIFKVFIEFVTILLLLFMVFLNLFLSQGMWDLNSLTRDRTHTPCIGRQSLNHWTAKEVPLIGS